MPISCQINRKKNKSKTQLLCNALEETINTTQGQIDELSEIKKDIDYTPKIFHKALEKGFIETEVAKNLLEEEKLWKNELKADVKSQVMIEKQRLKMEKKNRKKSISNDVSTKRRRVSGKFV